MKTLFAVLGLSLIIVGCRHPIEIVGEGDVLSSTGDRDCLLEDSQSGQPNCAENLVVGAYAETYYAVPRSGWTFDRWENYCGNAGINECSFNISAEVTELFLGKVLLPLVAVFREDVTGYTSLFMGHSFFMPFADGMIEHAERAGFTDHEQTRYMSGGESGSPQALWEDTEKRAELQALLNGGDIELFGMTYHPNFPDIDGYRNWVNYALQQNPNTQFFIGLPWEPDPARIPVGTYESNWETFHPQITHAFIDTLRAEFPGVDIYCIPYGEAAVELYKLFDADNLPDVEKLVHQTLPSIFKDSLGHPKDILVELGELVWLQAIYGVDLETYNYDPGYQTDLKVIAQDIMAGHDHNYDAP